MRTAPKCLFPKEVETLPWGIDVFLKGYHKVEIDVSGGKKQ